MNLRGALALGPLLAALACGGASPQPVTVTVRAPDVQGKVVPVEGAELTLLPFDIDSLYRALEKRNQAGPEPQASSLEPLFDAFNAADTMLPKADSVLLARQDSLERIQDRTSEAYRNAFRAYELAQAARDSLEDVRATAETEYNTAREAYNHSRQMWETSAWDGFDGAQEKLYGAVEAPRDSAAQETTWKQKTGKDGTFKVWIAPGRWWWGGRVAVPGSTNEIYRFNVPFSVGREPVELELTAEDAERMETY